MNSSLAISELWSENLPFLEVYLHCSVPPSHGDQELYKILSCNEHFFMVFIQVERPSGLLIRLIGIDLSANKCVNKRIRILKMSVVKRNSYVDCWTLAR